MNIIYLITSDVQKWCLKFHYLYESVEIITLFQFLRYQLLVLAISIVEKGCIISKGRLESSTCFCTLKQIDFILLFVVVQTIIKWMKDATISWVVNICLKLNNVLQCKFQPRGGSLASTYKISTGRFEGHQGTTKVLDGELHQVL